MANEAKTKKVYVATSPFTPVIGERYVCKRMECANGGFLKLVDCSTSKVQNFEDLGNNVFKVDTLNSTYYVFSTRVN